MNTKQMIEEAVKEIAQREGYTDEDVAMTYGDPLVQELIDTILTKHEAAVLEQVLWLLEENRKETMWGDKDSQEVSDTAINDFIEAMKSDLQSTADHLSITNHLRSNKDV